MATTVSYNGTNYTVPQPGNPGWGTTLTTYLVALASGSLTKAGGLMTLTAELDLGATYGIKSAYFSARGTPATAGAYRLENNTSISWRNAANDGNLNLTVNSSNALQFNSLPIVALALGAANTVLKMNSGGTAFEYGTLVNANINASAAIAYSKLNLANSIVNADISASAAIEGSKLVAASASVAGAMTTGTQTIAGNKTFTGVTALGTQATALSGVTTIISSDAAAGATQIAKVSDSNGAFLYLTHSRGTIGAESILSDGDEIGGVLFYGRGTSVLHQAASIRTYVDGTPGANDMPTRLEFATTPDGAFIPTKRMTIANDGAVTLGDLAGTGTRMVTADTNGELAASTIVESGTYTPTFTLTNGSSGTARQANYSRIGNIVTVTGAIDGMTVTTTGADFQITITSLPVASANFSTYSASGCAKVGRSSGGANEAAAVFSNSGAQTIGILVESTTIASGGTSVYCYYSFSYQIQ